MSTPLTNNASCAAITGPNRKATRVLLVDIKAAIENAEIDQSLGLLGMKERVALVGGSLSIESAPGGGTSLYVRIPISSQENGEVAQWTN